MPSGADNERVDVNADHREIAPAVAVDSAGSSSGSRIGSHHVSANVPHGNAAKGRAPDKTLATANTLNYDKGEGAHAEGLCDTVEAGGEELQGGSGDTQSLEDAGSVVCDNVDLTTVLVKRL